MEMSLENKSNIQSMAEKQSPILHTNTGTSLKNGNSNVQYGGLVNDTEDLVPPASKKMTCFSYLKTLTIEPAMFTFVFGYSMAMSCMTKMMMDKGCRYYYNYSEELCLNLTNHTEEKSQVEVLANNYSLYANLVSLVAALVMIIVAPWSDKYGRRLPMALACLGIIIGDICALICVIYFESSLYYLVLSRIPQEIFGGYIGIMTAVFSHASEVSSDQTRTQKYATVEIARGSGMALGGLTGGAVLRYHGYFYVYLIVIIIHFICFMWIIFFVQETRGLGVIATWSEKIRDLFKLDNLANGCKACVKHREFSGRILLFLFFASMSVIVLTYDAFGSIGFTYVHHIYDWDPLIYNSVNTVFTLTGMFALIIGIPVLIRFYKVTDSVLGMIGTISMIGKYVLIAFSDIGVAIFYIGNVVGSLSGVSTFTVRSGVSKIVDKDELGKIFSFLATCESILPMFGTIFITKVFNATINITPSVTYLLTAFLLLIPLGTFILAFLLTKRRQASELQSVIQ